MSASTGAEAVKAHGRFRDANVARAKATRAIQAKWVLDGELTVEQLIAERDRMRAECMARHPDWFGATA